MADATTQDQNPFTTAIANYAPSLLEGLLANGQTNQNKGLQDSLLQSSIGTLQDFANTVAGQNNPDLTQFIQTQAQLVQQGQISPAKALAAVQAKSNLYGIQVPQNFTDATNEALKQEQAVATQGYTPVERSAIQGALQNVINTGQGQQAAIKADQQSRGQYGGGQQLDQQLTSVQGGINNASQIANQTEANAYTRALQAIQNSGQLGLAAGQQSFNQQATVAGAQDAINSLNTQLQNNANEQNAAREQEAKVLKSNQDLAVQQGNLNEVNTVNQQLVGAANQTVQNRNAQQGLAGNALAAAGGNASKLAPSVYGQTQAGKSAVNQSIANGVGVAAKGLGSLFGSGSSGAADEAARIGAGYGTDIASQYPVGDWASGISTVDPSSLSDVGSNIDYGDIGNFDTSSWGFSEGGDVAGPGTEKSDSIPARLSNHEFVINADSAQKYKPLVEAINNDDEASILDALLPIAARFSDGPAEESGHIVVAAPKGKDIDGQKALSVALAALQRIGKH